MRKFKKLLSVMLVLALSFSLLTACGKSESNNDNPTTENTTPGELTPVALDDKYGACYQVFLYSFCDSNGDGIGDINGLTSKLDYIKELGFDSIWLLPFHQSTTYHKYDVVDYYSIDKQYGTMEDFDNLIKACNEKGIDIYMDFVINHSSTQITWFKDARSYLQNLEEGKEPSAEECKYFEYYNFVQADKAPNGFSKVPKTKNWYYECVFWDQMPDLNLDSAAVRKEIEDITKFWVDKGIKGFRLDAALHYYEGNIKKSTEALKWFCDYVYSLDPSLYIVAEVWSDATTIEAFYESGIDSLFNFPNATGSGTFVKSINRCGDGTVGAKLAETIVKQHTGLKTINDKIIDGVFLANHDTGRAAGYLYYNDMNVKLGAALELFTPGKAFVYYGDELGMTGSGPKDEDKRAPMYWTSGTSSEMTKGPAGMEPKEHKFPAYDVQKDDPNSVYNYYKKALLIRNAFPSIARGTPAVMEEVTTQNGNLYATSRTIDGETVYVIFNIDNMNPATVTVSKATYPYSGIAATLNVGTEDATISGETLTIPAFGCVILK
jgi:glycosidase